MPETIWIRTKSGYKEYKVLDEFCTHYKILSDYTRQPYRVKKTDCFMSKVLLQYDTFCKTVKGKGSVKEKQTYLKSTLKKGFAEQYRLEFPEDLI